VKSLQLDISFSRDYFTHHGGVPYQRAYFEDVAVRVETDRQAKRFLHERFGDIGLGIPDPAPVLQLGYDDTLNTTLLFGGELRVESGVSWTPPGHLELEAIDSLAVPAVEDTWPHTQFLAQYGEATRRFGAGSVRPPVPHGILEQALDLCGDAFLVELVDRPERAGRLLDVLAETVIRSKEFWDTKCFGTVRKGLSLGGCSTTMLSAQMVSDMLLPRYERIARRFGDAFICACGPTTQHLENWARIPHVRYVRCGWGTDLGLAARRLKGRHVKASLDVTRAATLPADAFVEDVSHVLESLRDVDDVSVLLIHASRETPDENVRRLAETVFAFARAHSIAIAPSGTCRPGA
jgi:hypothetical protein